MSKQSFIYQSNVLDKETSKKLNLNCFDTTWFSGFSLNFSGTFSKQQTSYLTWFSDKFIKFFFEKQFVKLLWIICHCFDIAVPAAPWELKNTFMCQLWHIGRLRVNMCILHAKFHKKILAAIHVEFSKVNEAFHSRLLFQVNEFCKIDDHENPIAIIKSSALSWVTRRTSLLINVEINFNFKATFQKEPHQSHLFQKLDRSEKLTFISPFRLALYLIGLFQIILTAVMTAGVFIDSIYRQAIDLRIWSCLYKSYIM